MFLSYYSIVVGHGQTHGSLHQRNMLRSCDQKKACFIHLALDVHHVHEHRTPIVTSLLVSQHFGLLDKSINKILTSVGNFGLQHATLFEASNISSASPMRLVIATTKLWIQNRRYPAAEIPFLIQLFDSCIKQQMVGFFAFP